MKVYIDILLITNAVMTMIYIESLCRITHRKTTTLRFWGCCCTGGISSLLIAAGGTTYISALLITIAKISSVLLIVFLVFTYKSFWEYIRYLLIYIAINLVFIGSTLILWQISDSKIIYMHNYTVYFDISLLKLTIGVIAAYILITLYEKISRRYFDKSAEYQAVYSIGNYEIKVPAVSDSGNKLEDAFTGMPVIIFYCDELFYHFDLDNEGYKNMLGFRLIPYNTINGGGLIHVTAKGDVKIIDHNDNIKNVKCYVGIVPSGKEKSRAIFNPILLG